MRRRHNKRAKKTFDTTKASLISALGRGPLSSSQLQRAGSTMFGPRWIGVRPQDRISWCDGFQVVNTDLAGQPGEHWVAIVIQGDDVYVHDSFGRASTTLLKHLTREARRRQLTVHDADYDAEQRGSSAVCGNIALAWLATVAVHGIAPALTI